MGALLCALLVVGMWGPGTAHARNDFSMEVEDDTAAPTIALTLRSEVPFEVVVGSIRIGYQAAGGATDFYYAEPDYPFTLGAQGGDDERWSGRLTFRMPDGSAVPPDLDVNWVGYERLSVAAGFDVAAWAEPLEPLVRGGTWAQLAEVMPDVRIRERVIDRGPRLHREQLERAGFDLSRFDHARVVALLEGLRARACTLATDAVLAARTPRAREAAYRDVLEKLGELDLRVTCMTQEAQLAAARALLRGDRPQDALVFRMRDEHGEYLPGWAEIYTESRVALIEGGLRSGVESVNAFNTLFTALENLRDATPDDPRLEDLARRLVANALAWAGRALERRDEHDATEIVARIRPDWGEYGDFDEVAGRVAERMLAEGIREAERGNLINARNVFVRGNRFLEGVPAWEARRDEINRTRALATLREALDRARSDADQRALDRAWETWDEAVRMSPLTAEDRASFGSDLAEIALGRAAEALEEFRFPTADHALRKAEEFHPEGAAASIRTAWLDYAEQMHAWRGMLLTGAQIEEARAALERAGDVDPERRDTIAGRLDRAWWGYRVGVPVGGGLVVLILLGLWRLSNRRGARLNIDDLD